jgi:uncharacterized protein (TIGR02444 family)
MEGSLAEAFWEYALTLYAEPGVERACLDLQDLCGLDVNTLLLCCWAGGRGVPLSADNLASAASVLAPWQDAAVRPLRAIRRRLKGWSGPLAAEQVRDFRDAIKRQELEAERVAQRILVAALADALKRTSDAPRVADNLAAYLRTAGLQPNARDREALDLLTAAALRIGAA